MKKTIRALAIILTLSAVLSSYTFVAADDTDSVLKDGNKVTLKVVFPGGTGAPASEEKVEAAINEIIAEYMDAEVDLEILEWGVYNDQQRLILSAGEDYALVHTSSGTSTFASSHQIMDITDLAPIYAPNAMAEFEKYLPACTIDGKLYGFPTFHEYSYYGGLEAVTSILDELGIDPSTITTWEDVDGLLATVKEAHPDMNILICADGNMLNQYYTVGVFDEISDGVAIYADDEETKVINMYDTPEYKELAEVAYDWNQKGYIIPDATTYTETRQELLAAGNSFGFIGRVHPGSVTQELKNSGVHMTVMPIVRDIVRTGGVNFSQYMVPSGCKNPEKALKLLDIMYTNEDVINLLSYGIEGEDYEIKDAENRVVGYPEGVDQTNVGWNNETWLVGNGVKAYVWESDPVDIWAQYEDLNNNSAVSPLFGFTFSSENVKPEITAISNVLSKYEQVIDCGYADPEESLPEFIQALQDAGIDRVIEEAQKQIDEWKATK